MSILSNSRFYKINVQNVDFVKSTFDKIDITYTVYISASNDNYIKTQDYHKKVQDFGKNPKICIKVIFCHQI